MLATYGTWPWDRYNATLMCQHACAHELAMVGMTLYRYGAVHQRVTNHVQCHDNVIVWQLSIFLLILLTPALLKPCMYMYDIVQHARAEGHGIASTVIIISLSVQYYRYSQSATCKVVSAVRH